MLVPANDTEQEYLWNVQADDVAGYIFIDISLPAPGCAKFIHTNIESRLNRATILQKLADYINESKSEEEVAKDLLGIHQSDTETETPKPIILSHLTRFIRAASRQTPWEFATTDQFPGQHAQCMVVARSSISIGKDVLSLEGQLSQLTPYALQDLEARSADFSVIVWNGKQHALYGPARYINHGCRPNARFRREGERILVRAIQDIEQGEEITVFYSRDYFEERNTACLCRTCRLLHKDGSSHESRDHGFICINERRENCNACNKHVSLYQNPWPNTYSA